VKSRSEISYGVIALHRSNIEYQVCLVYHQHTKFWGFPKGHPNKNESPTECALRELKEETGLVVKTLDADSIFSEQYTFLRDEKSVNKRVSYFIGDVESTNLDVDGVEISEAKWVTLNEALKLLSFPEAKRVLRDVMSHLNVEI
jgi:bis(5'-nucleosidyl)-tetraphosphatase